MNEYSEANPFGLGNKNTRLGNTEAVVLNNIAAEIHRLNAKWWVDIKKPCDNCNGLGYLMEVPMDIGTSDIECPICHGLKFQPMERNVGEMLMLAVSELAEAMEAHRKGLMDDKLPHRRGMEVEIADCVIRLFDLCFGSGMDIGNALVEKCEYNAIRADHKIENRLAEGGKKY